MNQDKIRLRLPNAREKLQSLFPQDSRGDIRIQFGQRCFKLQKAFLRLQSGYFKRNFTANIVVLSIKQNFNVQYFTNVLKCFYGFAVQLSRSEVLDYFPIVKFLEVQSLIKILRNDMTTKAEHYDIFILMQLAHRYDQQELFQVCLNQLEKEDFEQLRYAKMQLLHCPIELFKMVIKTHNRMKPQKGKGLPFSQINQIIKQFTEQKKMTQAQYMQLKFELIDKNCLTSQEYKQIFLEETKKKKSNEYSSSMIKLQSDPKITNSFRESPFSASRLTQSLINPLQKINDELTLEMENTFQKKKNEQLKAENEYLFKQLQNLKDLTGKNKKMFDDLKEIVHRLQKQLEEKEKVDKEQVSIINKLKKTCQDLQKELKDKGQMIKRLEDKVSKLQKQPEKAPQQRIGNPKYLNYDEDNDESKTIQTMILPGHLLKEIAKPAAEALSAPPNNGFKKANKVQPPVVAVVEAKDQEEDIDDQALQQLYSSRLAFDQEPRGCPKKYLPILANFLTNDGFSKKNLNLIFRRNIGNQQTKGNPNDIFDRSSLLVLICTRMNQFIGGFTQIEIQKGQNDYIKDSNAFIFSLNKNQKFNIKKNSAAEAIFITQEYLLCFSNDLMIPMDCIKSQSHSDWPTAYEYGSEKRSSKWLTGEDGGFSIKEIQIYQVREEAMTMDL